MAERFVKNCAASANAEMQQKGSEVAYNASEAEKL